ncbi:MAG TPA: sensor histidine kinase [Candidatus Saccharimonadales bacterium]|nr:sensor histidine kinase [Candidatus Saccharimonadales bacterium]
MDVREGTDRRDSRFDGLHADATAALAYGGNTLSAVRDRYRDAYREQLARWEGLRDELDQLERTPRARTADDPAFVAELHVGDLHLGELRTEVEGLTAEVGRHQAELARIELAQRTIESTWLFLERGDATLIADDLGTSLPADLQLRIVEAQEGERARLAQEVHDGPAQALTNAIFQVEYIERVFDQDPRLAQTELGFLRQLLHRELGDVRTFISQLRPRSLDQLGLEGSILEAAQNMAALMGAEIVTRLEAPGSRLRDAEQTVVLRLVQEALQNVRKHAAALHITVSSRLEGRDWVLEVRDDGRGFDTGTVASRGRRNFGLQFMRERAELIGARFEIRSRPNGGTVVWLAIPMQEEST